MVIYEFCRHKCMDLRSPSLVMYGVAIYSRYGYACKVWTEIFKYKNPHISWSQTVNRVTMRGFRVVGVRA